MEVLVVILGCLYIFVGSVVVDGIIQHDRASIFVLPDYSLWRWFGLFLIGPCSVFVILLVHYMDAIIKYFSKVKNEEYSTAIKEVDHNSHVQFWEIHKEEMKHQGMLLQYNNKDISRKFVW